MAGRARRPTVETAVMGDCHGPSSNGGLYRTSPLSADVINQLNDPKEAQSRRCSTYQRSPNYALSSSLGFGRRKFAG